MSFGEVLGGIREKIVRSIEEDKLGNLVKKIGTSSPALGRAVAAEVNLSGGSSKMGLLTMKRGEVPAFLKRLFPEASRGGSVKRRVNFSAESINAGLEALTQKKPV